MFNLIVMKSHVYFYVIHLYVNSEMIRYCVLYKVPSKKKNIHHHQVNGSLAVSPN